MTLLVIFLGIISACLAALWTVMRRPKGYPPGPLRWPLFGNLIDLIMAERFATKFCRWAETYGPVCSFKLGQHNAVLISDFDIAKEVLARETLADRPITFTNKFLTKFENVGLISCNGHEWREVRRFTLRNLRDFGFGKSSLEGLIIDELKELVSDIRPEGFDKNTPNVATLDEGLNAAVTNVIWWLMASKRVTKHDSEFMEILGVIQTFINFGIINVLAMLPSLNPFDPPSEIFRLRKYEERRDFFWSCIQRVVDDHRATLDENEPRDLTDCYLVQQKKLAQENPNHYLTDNMITASMTDLFIAGAETTSTTLRWFFLYMVEYPHVQKKIHEEIDRVIGRDREPSYAEHHEKMSYTTAAIWEIWRIVTIVSFGLNRRAGEDMVIGGFKIPKNTIVVTLIRAMHHDVRTFSDPEAFKPERFLDAKGKLLENAKIMPFQAGRRQCLGESLARMNAFLGATYLLQLFEFQKVPGELYDLRPQNSSQLLNLPRPFKVLVKPRF